MKTADIGDLRPWGVAPNPTRDQSLDPLSGPCPDPSPLEAGKRVQQPLFPGNRMFRGPYVKGLSRHNGAPAPLFHGSIDNGSAPLLLYTLPLSMRMFRYLPSFFLFSLKSVFFCFGLFSCYTQIFPQLSLRMFPQNTKVLSDVCPALADF